MRLRPGPVVLGGALVVLVAIAGTYLRRESRRRAAFEDALARATAMETGRDFARAVQEYETALELDLADRERAELRYRYANALITSGGLQRAMGVLQDLTEEDAAAFAIDLGPLYRDLGDRAAAQGNEELAKLAYQLGQAVSPGRLDEFSRRREQLRQEQEERQP
jgi:hypothetical protein